MSTQTKQNLSKNEKKLIWVKDNITRIEALQGDDFAADSHPLFLELTVFLKSKSKPVADWDAFFRHTNAASQDIEDKVIKHVLLVTHVRYVQSRDNPDVMTHREKCKLLLNIGLNFKEYSVQDAVVRGNTSMKLPCGTILKFKRRERDHKPLFKMRTTMYDTIIPENGSGVLLL
ncbi:hypothetical protein BDP27DRAFT_1435633 [Rhodocollybia butyracea]|uniref:Uncharacterized protein n=1 Tax=Rhodocollybia butyracea TaxID=206335 RepID=A0A9P5P2I3_9AGAR|nr:hypothetical protein BDP27DRAFT_1435633 [Rhodocollybia butyracea]